MLGKDINFGEGFLGGRSHVRTNREYLLKKNVASDLNTYLSFTPFNTFNDVMTREERIKYNNGEDARVGSSGTRSIFNKSGAVLIGGSVGEGELPFNASEWRISNNVPLIDSPDNRKRIRTHGGYTIKELVEASRAGILGRAIYDYSDFMYCKYLGTMPNNYLITLRRFPTPVDDYISSAGEGKTRKSLSSTNPIPIGTMVTWLNTSGNNIEDILNYSVTMPYEQKQAKWESDGVDADSSSKPLNKLSAVFDSRYRQEYQKGMSGGAINGDVSDYVGKLFPKARVDLSPPYHNFHGFQDSNKVYGPVDAIKKVYYRSDEGIDFKHSFDITFEYELRSYNGINGRQAMLDLISNILNVTYTTGTFWGGGYTAGGAHQNNLFANLNIMKASGGLSSFRDAFFQDFNTLKTGVKKNVNANGGWVATLKNFLNDIGGMLAGGLLNALGRPQKGQVSSLLSPAPTGFWHITIGNPFHPIMSMGNMILTNTTITHTGPLGLDDFPTGLKVKCSFDRGKPRDLRGIEMLYMNGNDRIYSSMGPQIFEMYTHSKEYRSNKQAPTITGAATAGLTSLYNDSVESIKKMSDNAADNVKTTLDRIGSNMSAMKKAFMRYFGHDDVTSIYIQATEQEYGAESKKKTKTGATPKPQTPKS